MQMSVQVDGFEDLFKRMDDLREEIGKGKTDRIWRKILTTAMTPVLDSAKADAPKKSGQLADHIYLKVHKPQNRDKSSKYYEGETYMARVSVSPLRNDTESHFVLNKRGKIQHVYRNKRPVALSQEFGNASTPAHPFLRPALERNTQSVLNIMSGQIKLFLDEYARQKKFS